MGERDRITPALVIIGLVAYGCWLGYSKISEPRKALARKLKGEWVSRNNDHSLLIFEFVNAQFKANPYYCISAETVPESDCFAVMYSQGEPYLKINGNRFNLRLTSDGALRLSGGSGMFVFDKLDKSNRSRVVDSSPEQHNSMSIHEVKSRVSAEDQLIETLAHFGMNSRQSESKQQRYSVCPRCGGSGRYRSQNSGMEPAEVCMQCNGQGRIEVGKNPYGY